MFVIIASLLSTLAIILYICVVCGPSFSCTEYRFYIFVVDDVLLGYCHNISFNAVTKNLSIKKKNKIIKKQVKNHK